MRTSLTKMVLLAALSQKLLDIRFNPVQGPKNHGVAWSPKRKKLKGWQKALKHK